MSTNETTRDILVAVDVQNDFINGSLPVNEGEQVVRPINDLAASVRTAGGNVAFTRDWHPAATAHFDTWPVHCVAGTPGSDFHPELDVREEDIIISKGMEQTDGYSGWEGVSDSGQRLESLIEPRTPEEKVRVYLGGLATDYCVQATGIGVAKHFEDDQRVSVYLLRDAIRAVNLQPSDEAKAIEAMEAAKIAAISCDEAKRLIEGTAS